MKKTLLLIGCILLFSTTSTAVNACILSPVAHLEGTVDPDTKASYIGHTLLRGDFHGYKNTVFLKTYFKDYPIDLLESLFNFSIDDISIFPLVGSSLFDKIDKITVVNLKNIHSQSLGDIFTFLEENVTSFSDVTVVAEDGLFILGINQGKINSNSEMNFAMSAVMNVPVVRGIKVPFLGILTMNQMKMRYEGKMPMLVQFSKNGSITIKDLSGEVLWNGSSSNKLFFIEDKGFSVTQNPPIHLFPLSSGNTKDDVKLTVTPAGFVDITSILKSIMLLENMTKTGDFLYIPSLPKQLQKFTEFISAASFVINGGMILFDTKDSFRVDNSSQKFSGFGFARGNKFDLNVSSEGTTVNGEYKLIFLGDHFYTSQAKESENGIAFPFPLLIVWIIAIPLSLYSKFFLKKKDVDTQLDEKIKKYAWIFHIIAIIVAFILMDREISYQFGISAIDAILGQGISMVTGVVLAGEFAIWVLGFFILAFPIRMIITSGLKFLKIGKSGKDIAKGVGVLCIWFFAAFYVKLVANIVFLLVNPADLLPMG
jgi:hypothetical protein